MGLLQEKLAKYDLPQKFMAQGVYPYFREIEGKQGTEVEMGGQRSVDVRFQCIHWPYGR